MIYFISVTEYAIFVVWKLSIYVFIMWNCRMSGFDQLCIYSCETLPYMYIFFSDSKHSHWLGQLKRTVYLICHRHLPNSAQLWVLCFAWALIKSYTRRTMATKHLDDYIAPLNLATCLIMHTWYAVECKWYKTRAMYSTWILLIMHLYVVWI